jgi:hypothetical protein
MSAGLVTPSSAQCECLLAGKEESETNIAVRFPQHLEAEEAECRREASQLVTAVGRVWCH